MRCTRIVLVMCLVALVTGCEEDPADGDETEETADQQQADEDAEPQQADQARQAAEAVEQQRADEDAESQPADDEADRHTEEGAFSYVPPDNWDETSIEGTPYAGFGGPLTDGIIPNIVVFPEPATGSYEDSVDRNLEELRQMFPDFELHDRREMTTDAGDRIEVLDFDNARQNLQMHQHQYYFDGGNERYIATCTRPPDADQIAQVCDESMETFRLE